VTRWCRLLVESGVPADPARLDLPRPPFAGPAWARGATLIHPGAASEARRWPPERWAAVARAERAAGRAVVVTGGPGEAGLARAVAGGAHLPRDAIVTALDLLGLAGLVGAVGRVACADTGVSHLATALGVPSVVLFGPTAPSRWGPPPDRPRHRALWAGDAEGDPHAGRPDPALLALEAGQVARALAEVA
jgi:ADP-heptose:LPS heptosyltransferase